MQSSIIPWHVFMEALAQQGRTQAKFWLDRWRFANDGVFVAHAVVGGGLELHLPDGSMETIGKPEKFVN